MLSQLPHFQDLLVVLLAVTTLLAMGMDLTIDRLTHAFTRVRTLIAALAINLVVIPLFAVALHGMIPMPTAVFTGFFLCMAAPGGGTGTLLTYFARGDTAFSVGLLVLLTLLSGIVTPLWLIAFIPGGASPGGMVADAASMAGTILVFMLIPLGAGLAFRHRQADWAIRLQPRIARVSLVLLLVLVSGLIFLKGRTIAVNGAGIFVASFLGVGLALASGFFLPRAMQPVRSAFALTSAVRNLSLALLLATTHYKDESTLLAILSYGLVMYGVGLPWAMVVGRIPNAEG